MEPYSSPSAYWCPQLKKIFDEFDSDGGGTIDTGELGMVMEKLGQHCTEAELMTMANEIDPTGSGEISFEQFKAMMGGAGNSAGGDGDDTFQTTIFGAFESVDVDRCGYVSAEQLKAVTTNLGEKLSDDEVQKLVTFCKEKGWTDEEGRISYRDWIKNEHAA